MLVGTRRILSLLCAVLFVLGASQNIVWAQSKATGGFIDSSTGAGMRPKLSAGEIASSFEITRPAVSQHLSVLREAGLVSERREGTRRLYSLRPEGFTDLKSFLEAFWDEGLERLKEAAETEEGRRRRGRRAA